MKAGEDVTLECQSPTDASISVIEWHKPDLKSDVYVFFVREKRPYKSFQHPSFHDRVELRDPEMKDGDTSVILKNVTVNDTGTYECLIITSKGDAPERTIIELRVKDGGNLNEHFGLLTALILSVIVGMIVGGFVLWTRQRSLKKNSEQPAADEADQLQKLSIPLPLCKY